MDTSRDGRNSSNRSSSRTLTASGSPLPQRRLTIDEYRRAQADRAIAKIEERYRRGLSIPDVR